MGNGVPSSCCRTVTILICPIQIEFREKDAKVTSGQTVNPWVTELIKLLMASGGFGVNHMARQMLTRRDLDEGVLE